VTGILSYVALLRGINVGGKNMLPMKDLAAMFEAEGCTAVRTYIQSGNVVFAAKAKILEGLGGRITGRIANKFRYQVPVVVRSAEEMARAIRDNPFVKIATDEKALFVGFLLDVPNAAAIAALDANRSPGDVFHVRRGEVYMHLTTGAAKTKLTNAYFDSKLKTVSTMRNWATVQKLLAMMREDT
jgi:uncharacterized protein (DUF1697 family)